MGATGATGLAGYLVKRLLGMLLLLVPLLDLLTDLLAAGLLLGLGSGGRLPRALRPRALRLDALRLLVAVAPLEAGLGLALDLWVLGRSVGRPVLRRGLARPLDDDPRPVSRALPRRLLLDLALGAALRPTFGPPVAAVPLAPVLSLAPLLAPVPLLTLSAGLAADDVSSLVIAYEPVWAIGTGRNATPMEAGEAHRHIRARLEGLFGAHAASLCRILYGGSVKPDNIRDLAALPDVDGALVGGASLDVGSFAGIVRNARYTR